MPNTTANRPARLLVVDDEEGLLYLMTTALRHEGYEVEGLDNGQEALDWLRTKTADLVLLDLNLGDLPAPMLLERLRRQGREFPFLIITAHGDERSVVELMKQGALDYVMKDKGLVELLPSVVRRALVVIERERRLADANDAIRRREERHRRIIETALDGFVRFDDRGQVLEVNDAFCHLVEFTREELLGLHAYELEEAGPQARPSSWIDAKKTGSARFFGRLTRRDRSVLDVEWSLHRENAEIFGFVHDVTQQRRLEREVLEISEDERRHFGRDLHDGLGQHLTALELMCHSLNRKLRETAPALAASAEEIAEYTRQAIQQTRRLAHGLAPVALEAEGLMAALNDLAQLTARAGISCELECAAPVNLEDPAAATHLYRIAQEAVNNALKHAHARHITLRLQDRQQAVELTIADDGRGLPGEQAGRSGMGLQVMDYRARLIGARLEIRSQPGEGVCIVCSLPRSR